MEINEEILDLIGIDEYKNSNWDTYKWNDEYNVPRVTNILNSCKDQSGLISWASKVGYKADYYRDKALAIGTIVHENIDKYLMSKFENKPFDIDWSTIDSDYRGSVFNCIENFKLWEQGLNKNGFFIEEIVGLEIPIVTPWYGGTCDGIVKINGLYYIIDFKTSKKISYDYLIQTCAYMYGINNGYVKNLPRISGIGIIRVDKSSLGKFEDLFLNNTIPQQSIYINNLTNCFLSFVEAYYRNLSATKIHELYYKEYDNSTVFREGE